MKIRSCILLAWLIVYTIAPFSICSAVQDSQTIPNVTYEYYFAYGSNLSYSFLKERLKNGDWIDDWHKSGSIGGEIPQDLGCYLLSDYEFGYTLDVEPFGELGTAANVIPKKRASVYGVLYRISREHLGILDKSEDVPIAYTKVQAIVKRVFSGFNDDDRPMYVKAWVYVGTPRYIKFDVDPDPEYMEFVVQAAQQRAFPQEYIYRYLQPCILHKK